MGHAFRILYTIEDTRKAQCCPIDKKLFLEQHEFLQKFSEPIRKATFNREHVRKWKDGETPPILQATFTVVAAAEEDAEKQSSLSSTMYNGPVDLTAGAQELGEHKESLPWSFLS